MSVIVTGATSMIGVSLLEELIKDPEIDTIYAVVHPLTKNTFAFLRTNALSGSTLILMNMKSSPNL